MDDAARQALEQLVRPIVSRELDSLSVELVMLRRELVALRAVSGLLDRGEIERRQRVAELRRTGASVRAIAAATGSDRATVTADLKALDVPRPARVRGLDGRVTRGPSSAGG